MKGYIIEEKRENMNWAKVATLIARGKAWKKLR
jgi:hypothetical protein